MFEQIALPHLLHTVTLTTSGVQATPIAEILGNRYAGGFETERGIVSAGVARAWMPMLTRALTLMPNLRRFSLGCSTEQLPSQTCKICTSPIFLILGPLFPRKPCFLNWFLSTGTTAIWRSSSCRAQQAVTCGTFTWMTTAGVEVEQGVLFAPLQGAPHLKTLCFFIYDNETLVVVETLARMTPELSFLYGIFIQDLLKDIRITEEAPEAFANVPLETVLLELQFDEVGEGIALSWARSVSTLKVIGVLLDGDPTKLEGKISRLTRMNLAGPSVRRLSAEREKSLTRSALDLWSCSRFGEL
ncbi:hypothetical protein BKA70DRAFT_1326794 [Coprinopsis sp. MPI-PUGE-AT-0042]|nr:hypothetical protein BKA70DRAFT_1326794 [Coprinopsis sp. MPI-PUGE-AT-0042]